MKKKYLRTNYCKTIYKRLNKKMLSSSSPEVLLGKGVLKTCSKFIGEHPCRNAILIKSQSNFIEVTLRHGCSPVNLLHIFRTTIYKNSYGGLLSKITKNFLIFSGGIERYQ